MLAGIADAACSPAAKARLDARVEQQLQYSPALARYHAQTRAQLGRIEEALAIYDAHVAAHDGRAAAAERAAMLARSGNDEAVRLAYAAAQEIADLDIDTKIAIWGAEALRRNDPTPIEEIKPEIGIADLSISTHIAALQFFAQAGMLPEAKGLLVTLPQSEAILNPQEAAIIAVELRGASLEEVSRRISEIENPIVAGMTTRSVARELIEAGEYDDAEAVIRLSNRPGSVGAGLRDLALALPDGQEDRQQALIDEVTQLYMEDTSNHPALKFAALAIARAEISDTRAANRLAFRALDAALETEDGNQMKSQLVRTAIMAIAVSGSCDDALALGMEHLGRGELVFAIASAVAILDEAATN